MIRTCVAALALMMAAAFSPSSAHAMERAAMDQILAMAKARPDSPAFREALIARLGEAAIAVHVLLTLGAGHLDFQCVRLLFV